MKVAIWLAYFVSLAGLLMAALLANSRVRQFIVWLWVQARLQHERISLIQRAELSRRYLAAYYLTETGALSIAKILGLAIVAASLSTVAVVSPLLSKTGLDDHFWLLGSALPLNLTSHLIAESAFAFVARRLILRPTLPSFLAFRLLAILGLIFIALYLLAISLAWGLYILVALDAKISLGPFLFATMAISTPGIRYLVEGSGSMDVIRITAISGAFLASGALLLGVLSATLVGTSRTFHGVLAVVCQRAHATSAAKILGASLTLFTIATGMMQAYGF